MIAVHGVQKMCHFFWRGKGIHGLSEENVYCSKLKIGYGCHVESGVEMQRGDHRELHSKDKLRTEATSHVTLDQVTDQAFTTGRPGLVDGGSILVGALGGGVSAVRVWWYLGYCGIWWLMIGVTVII